MLQGRHHQERVDDVQHDGILSLNNSRQIHNAILLNNKVEMRKQKLSLFLTRFDIKGAEVGIEELVV